MTGKTYNDFADALIDKIVSQKSAYKNLKVERIADIFSKNRDAFTVDGDTVIVDVDRLSGFPFPGRPSERSVVNSLIQLFNDDIRETPELNDNKYVFPKALFDALQDIGKSFPRRIDTAVVVAKDSLGVAGEFVKGTTDHITADVVGAGKLVAAGAGITADLTLDTSKAALVGGAAVIGGTINAVKSGAKAIGDAAQAIGGEAKRASNFVADDTRRTIEKRAAQAENVLNRVGEVAERIGDLIADDTERTIAKRTAQVRLFGSRISNAFGELADRVEATKLAISNALTTTQGAIASAEAQVRGEAPPALDTSIYEQRVQELAERRIDRAREKHAASTDPNLTTDLRAARKPALDTVLQTPKSDLVASLDPRLDIDLRAEQAAALSRAGQRAGETLDAAKQAVVDAPGNLVVGAVGAAITGAAVVVAAGQRVGEIVEQRMAPVHQHTQDARAQIASHDQQAAGGVRNAQAALAGHKEKRGIWQGLASNIKAALGLNSAAEQPSLAAAGAAAAVEGPTR